MRIQYVVHSCGIAAVLMSVAPSFAQAQDRSGQTQTSGKGQSGQTVHDQAQDAQTRANAAAENANKSVVGEEAARKNRANAAKPSNATEAADARNRREAQEAAKKVGEATTSAATVVGNGVADVTTGADKPGRYDAFAATYNPLGLIEGGRFSLNVEWVPVTHHGIIVSPHIIHTSADVSIDANTTASETFTGFGGELGYRYYTGHRGPNGFFIGPSLILGGYNASLLNGDHAFTDVGIAGDVGAQWIVWDHLVIGGGVGIEYLHVSSDFHDLPAAQGAIASTGVKPRLLFQVGYGL